MGRQSFIIGLGQIARSFQETANAEVIRALLHAHYFQQQYVRENGKVQRLDFLDFLARQRDYFAYFQKTKNGAALWDQETDRDMFVYHGQADTILVPDKMLTYITFRPENTDFYIRGPRGPDTVDDVPGKNSEITPVHLQDRLEPQRWMNKKRVYQVRAFHVDGVQPVDLLSKPIQIGEYYTMTDDHCIYDVNYSSTERAIMIFNEDLDRFQKIDLFTALENSQLFNGDKLRDLLEPENGTGDESSRDRMQDPFINKRTGQTVEYFGEIDPVYLPQDFLEKMGIVAAAKKDNGSDATNFFGGAKNAFYGAAFADAFADNDAIVQALKSGTKLAVKKSADGRQETIRVESRADAAPVSDYVRAFKDMIAASVRDDPDVQAQVRRFFPDNRAPTGAELDQLKQFAARNAAIGSRADTPEAYAKVFFDPRRQQLEREMLRFGKAQPKTAAKSPLLWVNVGDALPEGYEWLHDEAGEPIFSGLYNVSSVAQLPIVRAQRALQARMASGNADDDVQEIGAPAGRRYKRQGLIGMMEEFDEEGVMEERMRQRRFAGEGALDPTPDGNLKYIPIMDEYVTMIAQAPLSDEAKIAILLFLGAPVTKTQFRAFITYNLPFPGNFLLCRPHACYRGRSAIKCLAGQIGNTYMGHLDAELSNDGSRMIGLLHVVSYMSAIVTAPQHVYVELAPFVDMYYGGMNCKFWDPQSYAQKSVRGNDQSILCFYVPYQDRTFPNPLDIAGRFYTEFDYGLFNMRNRYEALHYSTAYRYNNSVYEMYTRHTALDDFSIPTVIPEDVNNNRICYQGAQKNFNRMTNAFDHETQNTGHWGPTYAGCARVRKGLNMYLKGTASIDVRTVN